MNKTTRLSVSKEMLCFLEFLENSSLLTGDKPPLTLKSVGEKFLIPAEGTVRIYVNRKLRYTFRKLREESHDIFLSEFGSAFLHLHLYSDMFNSF
jgi:hypothetical protein